MMTTPLHARTLRALSYALGFAVVGFLCEVAHTMTLVVSQDSSQKTMLLGGPCIGWMIGAALGGAAGWLERHRTQALVAIVFVLVAWPWLT